MFSRLPGERAHLGDAETDLAIWVDHLVEGVLVGNGLLCLGVLGVELVQVTDLGIFRVIGLCVEKKK